MNEAGAPCAEIESAGAELEKLLESELTNEENISGEELEACGE